MKIKSRRFKLYEVLLLCFTSQTISYNFSTSHTTSYNFFASCKLERHQNSFKTRYEEYAMRRNKNIGIKLSFQISQKVTF